MLTSLIMSVWKGGRGVKAPYESTHVRVPEPIKEKVQAIVQAYKDGILGEDESGIMSLEDALESARKILKQKKSARISLENLLSVIYGKDVTL